MTVVLGVDLSLRGTGLAAVPANWDCDWSRVTVGHFGEPLRKDATEAERIARRRRIVAGLVRFAAANDATEAWIEQYAFSARHSQAHSLGELGGVVKDALDAAGLPVIVVPPARARTLLGKAPRRDVKQWANAQLVVAGAPRSWTADELDAFAIANWALSEHGAPCLIVPRKVPSERLARTKRAA